MWNLVAIGPVVSEEKSFEIVDGRTDDGRTTEPAYTLSSPGAFGSCELKTYIFIISILAYFASMLCMSHAQDAKHRDNVSCA